MQTVPLGKSSLRVSRLAYGCWRIAETEQAGDTIGRKAILTAYECGYTFFDHADIYCGGRAESAFGKVLKDSPALRDKMVIASKCGIRLTGDPVPEAPFRYDFSAEHIKHSCEQSLRRLNIETIDLFQLHRPDWLSDPAEVAAAFSELRSSGKVREFGVSNFTPSQVTMLQQACPMPLVVNQVEISLTKLDRFTDGTLDQCVAEKITPLAWSPLGGGLLAEGARELLPWQQKYQPEKILLEMDKLALFRGITRTAIALAWLMKHPSGIVPIVGSTQPDRIRDAVKSLDTKLSREEWYRLLESSRGERLP